MESKQQFYELARILYNDPPAESTYKYPSGPTSISVTPPNPSANNTPSSSSSSFAILSFVSSGRDNSVLPSVNSNEYILPNFISPTKTSFSYCFPNLSEAKNFMAVTPTGAFHVNSGLLYFPLSLKSTRPSGSLEIVAAS